MNKPLNLLKPGLHGAPSKRMRAAAIVIGLMVVHSSAPAQSGTGAPQSSPRLELGAVLGATWQSKQQSLLHRDKGPSLGHSDVNLDARITPWLTGRLSAAAHSDHQRIETGIEEAYLDLPALPSGLQLRAGRFLSQLGYLNELHPHTDDFVMRPLLHRALLGDHYFDDGIRVNWVAPTPIYWRNGIELLRGKRLPGQPDASAPGAYSLSTRSGGDIGFEHSWQIGLAMLRHRGHAIGTAGESEHDEHDHDEDQGDETAQHNGMTSAHQHAHNHGALFFGRRLHIAELVWKWAPGGNSKARQLRLSAEYARVRDLDDNQPGTGKHSAWYLSAVYRVSPLWEVGARFDLLSGMTRHEDGYEPARLQERSLSVTYRPTHGSALRAQWSTQRDRGGFASVSEIAPANAVHIQFVQSLGAHGAHAF